MQHCWGRKRAEGKREFNTQTVKTDRERGSMCVNVDQRSRFSIWLCLDILIDHWRTDSNRNYKSAIEQCLHTESGPLNALMSKVLLRYEHRETLGPAFWWEHTQLTHWCSADQCLRVHFQARTHKNTEKASILTAITCCDFRQRSLVVGPTKVERLG